MPSAAVHRLYVPETAQVARVFIDELRAAHRALIDEIDNLGWLTGQAAPAAEKLTSARWKISQASLARRTLSMRIHDYFRARGSAAQTASLNQLQSADRQQMQASAAHVAAWTAPAIAADWAGYCASSRRIREAMFELVGLEQKLLYPMLESAAKRT